LTPHSGGTPCDINVIYTLVESTFCGLQFCRRHYGSIYIRSAVVVSQKSRNSEKKLNLTAVQGHPRSLILMSIESSYATSY